MTYLFGNLKMWIIDEERIDMPLLLFSISRLHELILKFGIKELTNELMKEKRNKRMHEKLLRAFHSVQVRKLLKSFLFFSIDA